MKKNFPRIFSLVFWAVLAAPHAASLYAAVPIGAQAGATATAPEDSAQAAAISDVQIRSLDGTAKKAAFTLAVVGEHLCAPGDKVQVQFLVNGKTTQQGMHPECRDGNEVVAEGETTAPSEITAVTLAVNGKTITSKGYKVSITPNPPAPKLKEFQIKFDHQKNAEFPNLHSVLVTKLSGEPGVGFDTNPNHMRVELIPTGATDINVVQSNEQQMALHFVAAANYEPKTVVVTVFNSSDLDHRGAVAVAKPASDPKPAVDPDQPTIDGVDVLFLERSQGRGRIRITGKGFGTYEPPPYPVDQYLSDCLQRYSIQGTDPDSERTKSKEAAGEQKQAEACRKLRGDEHDKWPDWEKKIQSVVNVVLTDRNPDLRVEKTTVLNINDAAIDVYFEFTRFRGFSEPFRPRSVEVTLLKTQQKTTQTEKKSEITATVSGPSVRAYTAQHDIGAKSTADLTYDYTMMDEKQASVMLGKGISQNFYVLKISVVNNGTKKVTIPLAAIQAEVEWARGKQGGDSSSKTEYLEGAPTITPSPLGVVSAYFDAYNKNHGKRAVLNNVLDALTLVGTALVPYTGPSFKDAQVFWSGGFVPGLHKAMGDISGQQLQNLTTLSWQNSESLPPQGGSLMKLIFIQKNPQFANQPVTLEGVKRQTQKVITNLLNLDITGYEVQESQPVAATPTGSQNTPKAPAPGSSSGSDATAAPGRWWPTSGFGCCWKRRREQSTARYRDKPGYPENETREEAKVNVEGACAEAAHGRVVVCSDYQLVRRQLKLSCRMPTPLKQPWLAADAARTPFADIGSCYKAQ